MARTAKKVGKGSATKGAGVKRPSTGSKSTRRNASAKSVARARPASSIVRDAGTGRAVTKARRTVTLDIDVVTELESRGGSVSAHLNEFALRCLEWDKRQEQILEMITEYEAEFGEIDEADVARWEDRLS